MQVNKKYLGYKKEAESKKTPLLASRHPCCLRVFYQFDYFIAFAFSFDIFGCFFLIEGTGEDAGMTLYVIPVLILKEKFTALFSLIIEENVKFCGSCQNLLLHGFRYGLRNDLAKCK